MRLDGIVAYPDGPLTLDVASHLLAEGVDALAQGATVFDLAAVGQVDSSALSLMLSWRRHALDLSRPLNFRNVPDSLHSLARLYGLADLIH